MYQVGSLKKEINKKLFANADSLVETNLSCPRIKLLNSKSKILHCLETRVLLADFAQQLRCENVEIPHIYVIILDPAGKPPTLVLNQNANAKQRESWNPFKN